MAVKTKFEEFISDMKSITQIPMFSLSPARKVEREDGDTRKDEKVKTKILEAWNNIRYDLGPIATLKKDTAIWILGVCHHSRSSVTDLTSIEAEEEDNVFDSPLDRRIYTDFASRPRFTYRKNFPPIAGTDITTDTGWGCMLRSAQMMIAQGLLLHFLGRDWRWLTNMVPTQREKNLHKEIIGWFIDDPSCPLSIHRLSQIGRKFGNLPGNWYGPNTVAHIMQNAVKEAEDKHPKLKQIAVYVAVDCTVYSEDVYDLCEWRKSMMIDKNIGRKSPKCIYSSTSSGSLKASVRDDLVLSEAPSPFTLDNVFIVEPTAENEKRSLADHEPPINTQATVCNKTVNDHNPTSSESISSLVSDDMGKNNIIPTKPSMQDSCAIADDKERLESWYKVPENLSSESYEDFKRCSEKKQQTKKFSFPISKKKKGKISLYKSDNENDDSQLNGRIIIPHFPVSNRVKTKTQKTSKNGEAESFMISPCTSKTLDKVPKTEVTRPKLKINDNVTRKTNKPVMVTPETPSPILFRRKNSKTGEDEILHSPDALMSKLSHFKWEETSKVDYSKDNFLSSYVEPTSPEQGPSIRTKLAKSEFPIIVSQTVPNIVSNENSATISHPGGSQSAEKSPGFKKCKNSNPSSPGKISDTQPIPINHSNTRDKSRLLRRSSSTPDFRPRSSTAGESPHTPRGSQKFMRKRSVPGNKTRHHKAVIILIPVRLGESALNPIYAPCVEAMLSLGSTIGIIGGKPKHSLYFVGCQGQGLLHLDPHYCQPADTLTGYAKNLHDYHTTQIRKVNVKKIDPSCCIGFYCRTPDEFEEFKIQSQKNFTPPQQSFSYPMCLIMDGRSGDNQIHTTLSSPDHVHNPNLSKDMSLPLASFDLGVDVGDNSTVRKKNSVTVDKKDADAVRLKKKKKGDVFSMDDVSSTLNKFNPLAKLMRKSPTARQKYPKEHEELESQFELL